MVILTLWPRVFRLNYPVVNEVRYRICMEKIDHWIYYLKVTKYLPEEYLALDQQFKKHGKSLVPISLRALLDSIRKGQRAHVLIVVKSFNEYKYFNKKVKKILKLIMRSDRVHLYMASSFSSINDPSIMKRDYYSFSKLPVRMDSFCSKVANTIESRENKSLVWPGGVRPKMSLVG